ncbi:hypothetical protein ACSN2T_002110 [Vibrio cholerae]
MSEKLDGIQMPLGRFATHSEVMDVMLSVYQQFEREGIAAQNAGKKHLAETLFRKASMVTLCKCAYAEKHGVPLAGSILVR